MTEKSREQKLRRAAKRVGLIAQKGRDPYGVSGWMIADMNNWAQAGYFPYAFSMGIDEAEEFVAHWLD